MNLEKIAAVRPGNYDMNTRDIIDIMNATEGDVWKVMSIAFRYGFSRGRNAEKANAKRKAVRA